MLFPWKNPQEAYGEEISLIFTCVVPLEEMRVIYPQGFGSAFGPKTLDTSDPLEACASTLASGTTYPPLHVPHGTDPMQPHCQRLPQTTASRVCVCVCVYVRVLEDGKNVLLPAHSLPKCGCPPIWQTFTGFWEDVVRRWQTFFFHTENVRSVHRESPLQQDLGYIIVPQQLC